MAVVGVRELKADASEIVRRVREHGETVGITYRGRLVARIVPVAPFSGETLAVWGEMDQLAAEIGTVWSEGVSAVDAVAEGRREL